MGLENARSNKKENKMNLRFRRLAYTLAAFALFLLVTYIIFTWGRVQ